MPEETAVTEGLAEAAAIAVTAAPEAPPVRVMAAVFSVTEKMRQPMPVVAAGSSAVPKAVEAALS